MTLTLRHGPLYDYAEYFLDEASEQQEICSATRTAIHLYGNDARVRDIIGDGIDLEEPVRYQLHHRFNICRALEDYACELIAESPPRRRAAIIRAGLLSLRYHISELSGVMAYWMFEDGTIGGSLKNHLRWDRQRITDEMLPTKPLQRKLKSRSAMKRHILESIDGTGFGLIRDGFNRLIQLPQDGVWAGDLVDEVDAIFADYEEIRLASRAGAAAYRERIWQEIMGRRYDEIVQTEFQVKLRPGVRQKWKREAAERKKMLKRSANIAAAIVGQETVRKFARGEPVIIEGAAAKFDVRRNRLLSTKGHGATRITVLHPTTGEEISGLCLYWPEVPALDQLATIGLYAQAGDDAELIAGGNVYSINTEATDLSLVQGRMRAAAEERQQAVAVARESRRRGRNAGFDRQIFDDNMRAYEAWAKPVFADLIGVMIFGRRQKAITQLSMQVTAASAQPEMQIAA